MSLANDMAGAMADALASTRQGDGTRLCTRHTGVPEGQAGRWVVGSRRVKCWLMPRHGTQVWEWVQVDQPK